MPSPSNVRPAALAASDTTLSDCSIATWSGVSFSGTRRELQEHRLQLRQAPRQRNQHALALGDR